MLPHSCIGGGQLSWAGGCQFQQDVGKAGAQAGDPASPVPLLCILPQLPDCSSENGYQMSLPCLPPAPMTSIAHIVRLRFDHGLQGPGSALPTSPASCPSACSLTALHPRWPFCFFNLVPPQGLGACCAVRPGCSNHQFLPLLPSSLHLGFSGEGFPHISFLRSTYPM